MKHYAVLSVLVLLAGCETPSSSSNRDEPTSRIRDKANCELKNGPTGCTLSNGVPNKSGPPRQKETYINYGPCHVKIQFEGESLEDWKRRDPAGSRCFLRENAKVNASIDKAIADGRRALRIHEERERNRRAAERQQASSNDDSSAGVDTSGTWYCDTLDGSGMYGTYGMVDSPRVDRSSCKKVD